MLSDRPSTHTARHPKSELYQGAGSLLHQPPVHERSYPRCHRQLRAVVARYQGPRQPRHERRLTERHLQGGGTGETVVRIPSMVGFTTAPDRQRIDAFVRRGVLLGLYSTGEPAPTQLINSADDALFERIFLRPTQPEPCVTIHRYPISTQQVRATLNITETIRDYTINRASIGSHRLSIKW